MHLGSCLHSSLRENQFFTTFRDTFGHHEKSSMYLPSRGVYSSMFVSHVTIWNADFLNMSLERENGINQRAPILETISWLSVTHTTFVLVIFFTFLSNFWRLVTIKKQLFRSKDNELRPRLEFLQGLQGIEVIFSRATNECWIFLKLLWLSCSESQCK